MKEVGFGEKDRLRRTDSMASKETRRVVAAASRMRVANMNTDTERENVGHRKKRSDMQRGV